MKHARYRKQKIPSPQLSFFGQRRNRTALVEHQHNNYAGIHRADSTNNSASFLLLLSFAELISAKQALNYIYNGTQYLLSSNTSPNEMSTPAIEIFPKLAEIIESNFCGNVTLTNGTLTKLKSLWDEGICGYQFSLNRNSEDPAQLEFENCSINAMSQTEQSYNAKCTSSVFIFFLCVLMAFIALSTVACIFYNYSKYTSRHSTRRDYDSIRELSSAVAPSSHSANFVTELTDTEEENKGAVRPGSTL